jgi:hypothetical protein
MSRLLLPIAALAALAVPAPASAKQFTKLAVCGTDGCHATRDKAVLEDAMTVEPQAAPDHGGACYRLRVTIGGPEMEQPFVQRMQWIPSLGLLRDAVEAPVGYSLPRPPTEHALRRLSRGLHPFAARRLGPILRAPQGAKVDEVVTPPAKHDGGGGGSAGWAWSLLSIIPAGIAFLWTRRRRGRASLA